MCLCLKVERLCLGLGISLCLGSLSGMKLLRLASLVLRQEGLVWRLSNAGQELEAGPGDHQP
jgi:hypothetical protein